MAIGEPFLAMDVEGEALANVLAARFVIERNGSVSDRLWRLVTNPDDLLELPRVPELGQHAVDVPRRRMDVLEEENATVQVELPRGRERLAEQPQAATDEGRGCTARAECADVRVLRAAGDLAEGLGRRERAQQAFLRPLALRIAHSGQPRPVERHEPGALPDGDVQRLTRAMSRSRSLS